MDATKFKKKAEILVNYYNAGEYLHVIREVQTLLKKVPNNPFLMNLLGSAFQNINELDYAKETFLRITKIDPKNISAFNNLGNVLKNQKDYSGAFEYYFKALELNSNYSKTILNLGNLNFELNKYEQAIELYKRALKIENKLTLAHYNLALAYQSLGEFDNAKKHLRELLNQVPEFTIADKIISRITKYSEQDPHLNSMVEKLHNLKLDHVQKINLYFAIGKAYEDIKNFKNSFDYLKKANELKDTLTNYKIEIDLQNFETIKNFFKNKKIDSINPIDNKKMIFIVGMPRSGTSLVEQILASHSKVYGCGELMFLEDIMRKKIFDKKEISIKKLNSMDDLTFVEIAKDYMNKIQNYDNEHEYLTDKAPLNFRWIGLIKILFPNSRIVHCIRSAKDNCISLYKNSFDDGLDWTYNQENLIKFYKGYEEIIQFWQKTFPGYIHNINYEELVNNPKKNVENLLKYCDLNFEEKCLEFYKNKRPIKTVSAAQARQPLYKSSVSSYENFEPFMRDFFSKL